MRAFLDQTKQDEFRFERGLRHAVPHQAPIGVKLRIEPCHPKQSPAPIVQQAIEGLDVMPKPIRPIQRRACKAWSMCHRLA